MNATPPAKAEAARPQDPRSADRRTVAPSHQEQLFARFVAENPNPVMIAETRGAVVWANKAARSLASGPLDEVLPGGHRELVTSCRLRPGEWQTAETTIGEHIYNFAYLCSQSTSLVHVYGRDVTEERRLERQERRMAQLHQGLIDAGVWLSETLDLGLVVDKTLVKARELLNCRYAALAVLNDGRITEFYTSGMTAEEAHALGREMPSGGLVGHLVETQRTLRIDDVARHPSAGGFPAGHPAMQSFLGTPLRYGDTTLGILYLTEKQGGSFTEFDEQAVEMLAMQAASAINNAQLYEEIRHFNQELEDKIQARTRELSHALRLAEAANASKSTFLASMSHELRTPLNAVIGFAEVLQDKFFGPLTDKQAEYVTDILESGHHLLSLINDILDISKVEAGQIDLEMRRMHLPAFLETTLVFVREKAAKHGIELAVEIDQDVPEVMADERRIKQVLFNLLSNAVKFTPDGGRVTLACGLVAPGELPAGVALPGGPAPQRLVAVAVSDTGIGIAPEHQAKVFDQFYQVKGDLTGKTPGTGLGLTITRQIVGLHGGAIWLASKGEGHGCTFTFALPALAAVQGQSQEHVQDQAQGPVADQPLAQQAAPAPVLPDDLADM